MTNWKVTITESDKYVVEVEAETEREAIEKAEEATASELGKTRWHYDSDGGIEATEL